MVCVVHFLSENCSEDFVLFAEAAYFPDSVEDALWSSSGTSSLDPNDPA